VRSDLERNANVFEFRIRYGIGPAYLPQLPVRDLADCLEIGGFIIDHEYSRISKKPGLNLALQDAQNKVYVNCIVEKAKAQSPARDAVI
jgi:hypothetical protein